MKRFILTTIVCFILCLSFSFDAFASGVGGSLGGIGSGIDPRTDSRYKDKFQLDSSSDADKYFIDNNARYGDVIFTYFQNVDVGGEIKQVALKCYFRIWYISSEYNNPCIYLNQNANGFGNLQIRYLSSEGKRLSFSRVTERYDGLFDTYHGSMSSNVISQNYFANSSQIGEILYSDFPVFSNITDCDFYCSTNQVRNAIYDPSPNSYSQELYFKSFDVIPHVSNSAKYYYFDIKYELSDLAKKNIDKLNLNFENSYRWESSNILQPLDNNVQTSWVANSISLKEHPYGFSVAITDLNCYEVAVNQWGMSPDVFIGNKVLWDITNSVVHTVLSDVDVVTITEAYLYFKFNLRFVGSNGVVVGKRNDFTYDILNKTVDKYIYTPYTTTDSSGNTTFVKDDSGNITYTQQGDKVTSNDYYYNKVTETNEGDTTNVSNNYYYYDKDGKEQEISEDDYNNSSFTVIGGDSNAEGGSASVGDINIDIDISTGQGEYVNMSPADFKMFVEAMQSLFAEVDTGGGLFLLLKDIYSIFPVQIWLIISGGLGATIFLAIYKIVKG